MIRKIISGGQSGVDRAALNTAKKHNIRIGGWCPKGGWAEDYPDPPGIRMLYPELKETPSKEVEQRTIWNVRDADATLIIYPVKANESKGTELTEQTAIDLRKPYLKVIGEKSSKDVIDWLNTLSDNLTLNIAGPRKSECPEAYQTTIRLLQIVLTAFK